MECPACAANNPENASECRSCHTPLRASSSQETFKGTEWSAAGVSRPGIAATDDGKIKEGTVLGGRYEILKLLGQGGMGAVYKAHDIELDRTVALKLIRPELAKNPEVLHRFKQELLLARQITHKNVIRIYDLGQADGVKFITMDFVEGQDLRHLLLEQGKFPPEQAARMMLQICRALEAAHGERVIHRDLKPQNIMVDTAGRVFVMDFGIARQAHLAGMTQTGALIGTPEYMSPEQARGERLTESSDLFSLGVIFYELLTAKGPYPGDAPLATLWRRLQEKPKPPAEVDPTVPKALNDIVMKALEIEPTNRWASAKEIADQLEIYLGPSAGSSLVVVPAKRHGAYWKWATIGLAAVLIVSVAFRFVNLKPKPPHLPVSVLVADFTNHTGDPIFDGTLEPMFNVALEGASFVKAFSRGDARRLAGQLPHPSDKLDEQPARLVAINQGVGAVVTGELSRRGNKYSLSATALDAVTGNVIAESETTAENKDAVLLAIPKLAAPIRKALGDTTPESVQVQASVGAFTAASMEAVHQYSLGEDLAFAGKMQEALQAYSKAVELDPNFARAYAGQSGVAANLGQFEDSEKYAKQAIEHIDRMTEHERYRVRGLYYMGTGNWQKCVEEYTELINRYPVDNIANINLASCYGALRNFPKALETARRAVEASPQSAQQRFVLSFTSSYAGDFQAGEVEARNAIKMTPSHDAYLALAEAQLGLGQLQQASETYQTLEKLDAVGASTAASGLADLAAYEGHYSDAARILEKAADADLKAKRTENAANKYAGLANVQLLRGQKQAAITAADKAVAISQTPQVQFLVGRAYLEAGEIAKVKKLASALSASTQAEPQAYGQILEGESELNAGDARRAIKLFTDANNLLDTWMGRLELGRAYLQAGLFVEADGEFEKCLKRRGEALEILFNSVPSYAYLPPVYYYRGQASEGMKSIAFLDAYHTYLNIRQKSTEDKIVPDIRRRLCALGKETIGCTG